MQFIFIVHFNIDFKCVSLLNIILSVVNRFLILFVSIPLLKHSLLTLDIIVLLLLFALLPKRSPPYSSSSPSESLLYDNS